jgi:hypothetical protein
VAIQRTSSDQHPVARAYHWVSIVTTAVAFMVLPGLGGQWLDGQWGTRFLALLGFSLGLVGGVGYLLLALSAEESRRARERRQSSESSSGGSSSGGISDADDDLGK